MQAKLRKLKPRTDSGDGYSQPRRAATWTDESDDAPLHHYPRSTDKMASAEELITLGVQYAVRVDPFFVPNPS